MTRSDEDAARRGFGFTAAALLMFVLVLSVTYLPENVAGKAVHSRQDVAGLLWPMRWHFYTGESDREYAVAYRLSGETLVPLLSPAVERQWGLNRSIYGDYARLLSMVQGIPPSAWRDCVTDDVRSCSRLLESTLATPVPSKLPQACGYFIVALEHASDKEARQIRRVASVDLKC